MPTRVVVDSELTLAHLMRHAWSNLDAQGASAEADADRLLLSDKLDEALQAYQGIEQPPRRLREKMSFVLWIQGDAECLEVLGNDLAASSPEGLVMLLRGLAGRLGSRDVIEPRLVELVDYLMDELPISQAQKEQLLAASIYLATASLHRRDENLYPACCERAVDALAAMNSPYANCMEVFACARRFYASADLQQRLVTLVEQLEVSSFPELGIAFTAARRVGNLKVARIVIDELCRRHSESPRLVATVAIAAIAAKDMGLIEALPEALREQCLAIPDILVLKAVDRKDATGLLKAISLLDDGFEATLREPDAIQGNLQWITSMPWGCCPWQMPPSFLGEWAPAIAPLLPPGDLRDRILLDAGSFGSGEQPELIPLFCELFNRKPCMDTISVFDDEFDLTQLNAASLAEYIYTEAIGDDPYCGILDPECAPNIEGLISIGVADILLQKADGLAEEARNQYLKTLAKWRLIDRLESSVRLAFRDRLTGSELPPDVAQHLEGLRGALGVLPGEQLVYLQAMLMELVHDAGRSVPVAAAEGAVITAVDEIVDLHGLRLLEHGHERIRNMTARYGAPKLLFGLRDLTKPSVAGVDMGGGILDTLARHMVRQQGSLAPRRSYLAGILRKRLPNLRGNWLDQQVSGCLNRGIDIEQMIELAKQVTTWDEWAEGINNLRPY